MKVYRPEDITEDFKKIIKWAEHKWDLLVNQYIEKNPAKNGMHGSCVIGDGFYINFIPKGKRKPIDVKILNTCSAAIGSLPWEATKDEVMDFLKSEGIECFYQYGRLD